MFYINFTFQGLCLYRLPHNIMDLAGNCKNKLGSHFTTGLAPDLDHFIAGLVLI